MGEMQICIMSGEKKERESHCDASECSRNDHYNYDSDVLTSV